MKENIDLQKELLMDYENLVEGKIHRIINIRQNVEDLITLLQSDPELMRSYFKRK
jgi:aromatic ring hydroxylase